MESDTFREAIISGIPFLIVEDAGGPRIMLTLIDDEDRAQQIAALHLAAIGQPMDITGAPGGFLLVAQLRTLQ